MNEYQLSRVLLKAGVHSNLVHGVRGLEAENERLRDALAEARPYVFNRTQESDWRGETARSVLALVDAALAVARDQRSEGEPR